MSWVNLDDVYVNKTGDTIAGDLSVGGALTINDGKGTDTTYNVANEITTLRDSVSRANVFSGSKVITFSSERHALFEVDEQQRLFGRALDAARDYVGVMNGDGSVSEFIPHVHITNGRAILVLNGAMHCAVRINYVVVLGS